MGIHTDERRPHVVMVAVVAALVLAAGCGNRLPHEEIEAAAGGVAADEFGSALTGPAPSVEPTGGDAGTATPSSTAAANASAPAPGGATQPSTENGQTPAPAAAAGTCPQGALSPVRIGHIGSYSGVVGAVLAGGRETAQVWARSVNTRGGLNCHPVDLVTANDEGDPARNAALARQMVEEQGVIAFVGNQTPLSTHGSVDFLTQRQVPVVGGDIVHPAWFQSPILFPQGTESIAAAIGTLVLGMERAGGNRVAIWYCGEATACTEANAGVVAGAEAVGAEVVYNPRISLGQQNFALECSQSRDRGAQVIFVAADGTALEKAADSCATQGYRPQFVTVSLALVNAIADNPNLEGMVAASQVFPWPATDTPAAQEFAEAMQLFAPNLPLSGATAYVWTAGKLLEAAGRALPAEPASADILAGLYALQDETLGGLAPPLRFVEGSPAPKPTCYFAVGLEGGQFTAPRGSTLLCP